MPSARRSAGRRGPATRSFGPPRRWSTRSLEHRGRAPRLSSRRRLRQRAGCGKRDMRDITLGRKMNDASLIGQMIVGSVPLPNGVLLAPMSGVTDAPFRRLASDLGAGLVISEMTACAALAEGKRIARKRAEAHGAGPHVVQIAGCEARWMAEGARVAEALGADIIDINMGCPAKHVTNGASGSALMRDLDHALTLIDAVVGAVGVPVTLKMRLGWDERSHNAAALARGAPDAGGGLVPVHGGR